MTRKRTRESLAHVLCEPAHLPGARRSEDRTDRVLRDPARDRARRPPVQRREYRILASQQVITVLDEESQSLAQLSDFIGKPVSLQVETFTRKSNTMSS